MTGKRGCVSSGTCDMEGAGMRGLIVHNWSSWFQGVGCVSHMGGLK